MPSAKVKRLMRTLAMGAYLGRKNACAELGITEAKYRRLRAS